MEKATIYNYARMCKAHRLCGDCPVSLNNNNSNLECMTFVARNPDKANEIILKWCEEHPIKTRQNEFLKMFPNAMKDEGIINIDPCIVDETLHLASSCWECAKKNNVEDCAQCCKEYWLAEVEE